MTGSRNLSSNAVKFSHCGTAVQAGVTLTNGVATVAAQGILAADLPRSFEPV